MTSETDRRRGAARGEALLVFLGALAFYLATLAPTTYWVDSAQLAARALAGWELDPDARRYPLFTALCRIGPGLAARAGVDFAYGCNVLTAALGAASVALAGLLAGALGAGRAGRLSASASLLAALTAWQCSVATEVYSLYAVLALAALWALVRWKRGVPRWLVAAGLLLGLGLVHHRLAFLLLPPVGLYLFLRREDLSPRDTAAFLAAVVLGFSPMLWIGTRYVLSGHSVSNLVGVFFFSRNEVWKDALFGPARLPLGRGLALFAFYQTLNFVGPALALAAWGAVVLVRRRVAEGLLLLGVWATGAAFAVRYNVEDPWVFYYPCYLASAVWVGIGADALCSRMGTRAPGHKRVAGALLVALLFAVPLAIYAAVPRILNARGINLFHRVQAAEYQERFFFPDLHGDDRPRRFADEMLDALPEGAVLFADFASYGVLRYAQLAEARRTGVRIEFLEFSDAVYLARECARKVTPGGRAFIALWPYHKEFTARDVERVATRVPGREPLYAIHALPGCAAR